MNPNFRSIKDGQVFRHNGKRYRRKNARHAVALDGGRDILGLACNDLIDLVILDVVSDGELDGNFTDEGSSSVGTIDATPSADYTDNYRSGGYESPSYDYSSDYGSSEDCGGFDD